MTRYRCSLLTHFDGSLACSDDFDEIKEDCDIYRANGYQTVVVLNETNEVLYPEEINDGHSETRP